MNVIKGESELADIDDIAKGLSPVLPPTPPGTAPTTPTPPPASRPTTPSFVYQDTYIMGDPGWFMHATEVEVPEKYFTVK